MRVKLQTNRIGLFEGNLFWAHTRFISIVCVVRQTTVK